jgi:hypothetical protein
VRVAGADPFKCRRLLVFKDSVADDGRRQWPKGSKEAKRPVRQPVRPEARGCLLGAALTAGAINQAEHDIASLHEQLSRMASPPIFTTRVAGSAYSPKGLAALDDAWEAVETFAGDVFEDEIECEADYSI